MSALSILVFAYLAVGLAFAARTAIEVQRDRPTYNAAAHLVAIAVVTLFWLPIHIFGMPEDE